MIDFNKKTTEIIEPQKESEFCQEKFDDFHIEMTDKIKYTARISPDGQYGVIHHRHRKEQVSLKLNVSKITNSKCENLEENTLELTKELELNK